MADCPICKHGPGGNLVLATPRMVAWRIDDPDAEHHFVVHPKRHRTDPCQLNPLEQEELLFLWAYVIRSHRLGYYGVGVRIEPGRHLQFDLVHAGDPPTIQYKLTVFDRSGATRAA